ncbi:hypothetical protein DITRI_Ditri18aG0018800 [Diplodiscus trichospermus]
MKSTNDINEATTEIERTISSLSKSFSKRFNKIWEDFDIVEEGHSPTKRPKAICKHCRKGYSIVSRLGTSHIQCHLEGCNKHLKEIHTEVDQHAYRELVDKAIIKYEYTFTWVEHGRNRDIHISLNKSVEIVSRNTIKVDYMKLLRKLKRNLHSDLKNFLVRFV